MEKFIKVSTQPFPPHEEGIGMAVQRGYLFRNNAELNKLYQEGYRIQSYEPAPKEEAATVDYFIQVHLVK